MEIRETTFITLCDYYRDFIEQQVTKVTAATKGIIGASLSEPHIDSIIGASLSEPHTSESNGGFSYIICRTYVVP